MKMTPSSAQRSPTERWESCTSPLIYSGSTRVIRVWVGYVYLWVRLCLCLGFVNPLQDVALHQYLPLSSVCCFPNPVGSFLLCYVVLPSSAWSSSWSLPSPWLPLCAAFGTPIVRHLRYMTGPFPLLFQCLLCDILYWRVTLWQLRHCVPWPWDVEQQCCEHGPSHPALLGCCPVLCYPGTGRLRKAGSPPVYRCQGLQLNSSSRLQRCAKTR